MKKYFLILIILLLTGCKAEYNLSYVNDEISESLSILSSQEKIFNGESFSNIVEDNYINRNYFIDYRMQPGDISEEEYPLYDEVYNKYIVNDNGLYGINLNYTYNDQEKYVYSSIVNNLYEKITINEYYIKTSNIKDIFSTYPDLNLIIKFNTDKKILSSNADEEKNGIYYWYVNQYNYLNKEIDIKFDLNNEKIVAEDGYITYKGTKYILFILLIILLISIIIVYDKVRKSNQ